MIIVALAAALCFALSSALHQRAAKQQPQRAALDPRLILHLLRSRLWLSGWIPDSAGVALQVAALRLGPLAVVQPVMASGLFMAVLIEAALIRRRVVGRDLIAVAVGVAGLTGFLVLAEVRAGVGTPDPAAWIGPAIGATLIVAICLLTAHRLVGTARGAVLGVASGIAYSLAAALAKEVTDRYRGDLLETVLSWPALGLAVAAAVGVVLNQSAFQHGRLAAPLTALTLTDPVVSVLIGITVFQETLTATPGRVVGLALASATVAAGVWLAGTASEKN
ncbi:DMT family transporter [Micromonospora sp. CA-263727]|uniref:DMT family transporter n=1 Tax=Micromonospora sp. CA-263727 TaxID=3239967 RepID=UPI003D95005C